MNLQEVNRKTKPELFYLATETVYNQWAIDIAYALEEFANVGTGEDMRTFKCILGHTSSAIDEPLIGGSWNECWQEVDSVYHVEYKEEVVATGKKVKKKAANDHTVSTHLDEDFIYIYYDDQLAATWEILPQYYLGNKWRDLKPPLTDFINLTSEMHLVGQGTDGAFSWDIDIDCSIGGSGKWTVNVTAPGQLIRAVWNITLTALGEQLMTDGLMLISTEDYTGNILDDQGSPDRQIIFEPDGVNDSINIDPYLTISDESNHMLVKCDGYYLRIYFGNNELGDPIYDDANSTQIGEVYSEFRLEGGTTYALKFDQDRVAQILENTPTRIVISQSGNFEDTNQNTLANSTSLVNIWTIYPDRFSKKLEWVTSGSIDIDDSWANRFNGIEKYNATNIAPIGGDGGIEYCHTGAGCGNETDLTEIVKNDFEYIGYTSDEMNVIGIELEHTDDTYWEQYYFSNGGNPWFRWTNSDTFPAGTHTCTILWILDNADREGGKQYDSSALRLELGDQYKDETLDQTVTDGDDVTDLNIPARIGTGTLHADGADHYDALNSADGVTDIDIDIDRHGQKLVVHDWPFQYGTVASPTTALIEHIKHDDNAASSTVVATVGNNANWEDSAGTNRNTSNDDVSSDIFRGTGLDTGDTYHTELTTTVYDNAFFKQGSVILEFTPQFGYADAADQTLWHLWVDADDYLLLVYDAGNDKYEFRVSWGGTLTTIDSDAYTSDTELQIPTVIQCSWDSEQNVLFLWINGQLVDTGTNSGTPSASGASYVCIGAMSDGDGTTSLNADVYLDEYKALDGCVLHRMGAYDIGNGEGLLADISNPLADLCYFADMQAVNAYGGANLATAKNLTNTSGSFVTTDPILGTTHFDGNSGGYLTVAESAEDIIDYSQGGIAMWVNIQAITNATRFFEVEADSSNEISMRMDAAGNLDCYYEAGNTVETINGDIAMAVGEWHWIRMEWDDAANGAIVRSWVDEIPNGTWQTVANSWGGSTSQTLYFGSADAGASVADIYIGAIYIYKGINPPQISTLFGKPLHTPIVNVK